MLITFMIDGKFDCIYWSLAIVSVYAHAYEYVLFLCLWVGFVCVGNVYNNTLLKFPL